MNLSQIAIFSFRTGLDCRPRCTLYARLERKRPELEELRPEIRRAGNAFVHLPDEPSASA